ncbi:unnamed protein product [Lasius platythorax]|uniref:Uncharacterized protein n=1 Tax=Lasius platythorax TaxID=488582 RepID=A0AAV2NRM4_9HYME
MNFLNLSMSKEEIGRGTTFRGFPDTRNLQYWNCKPRHCPGTRSSCQIKTDKGLTISKRPQPPPATFSAASGMRRSIEADGSIPDSIVSGVPL